LLLLLFLVFLVHHVSSFVNSFSVFVAALCVEFVICSLCWFRLRVPRQLIAR
jgi:uncharacterized membrane protein YciS (DUF1049 family)